MSTTMSGDSLDDLELQPILNGEPVDLVEVVSLASSGDRQPGLVKDVSMELTSDREERGEGIKTPLHTACQTLDAKYVHKLLEMEDDVNAWDERGLTPLDVTGESIPPDQKTAQESFLDVINVLIAHGGTRTSKQDAKYCETPMHVAVNLNCMKAVHTLLIAGYEEPLLNSKDNTALHDAAFQRYQEPLKVLASVYGPAGINMRNRRGETALHTAVQSQFLEGVRTLIRNGADLTVVTCKQKNVLHLAATKNHVKIMKELLHHKESKQMIDEQDACGETPLFHSVFANQYKTAVMLLKANADLTIVDDDERTVLQYATESRNQKMLKLLFENGAPWALNKIKDYASPDDLTALHIAASKGDVQCTQVLIKNGCNLRQKALFEDRMVMALHLATIKGHEQVVRIFLDSDPTLVNDPDSSGLMPIHWACINCHSKVIKTIVNYGCDLSARCVHPDDGTTTTAIDLFINRVPGAVELVENILDDSISIKQKSIAIEYKILLPKQVAEDSNVNYKQLEVISALVETGDLVNQGSLFVHPVIESFLCLQWERICRFYFMLILTYLLFVIPFTINILMIFYVKKKPYHDTVMEILRVLIVVSSIIYIPHQFTFLYLKTRNSRYFMHWECSVAVFSFIIKSIARFFIIIFMFVVFVCVLMNSETYISRELATVAIFLFAIEFMLLISRVPKYGLYMLMFFKVTTNFFNVLLSFMFLIAGFVIIFLVEFEGQAPFTSTSEALMKTVVMMTNEFDYKDLFENFEGSKLAMLFSKLVFLVFLLLVCVVTMNILLAKAILDVEKVDRLRKQAEFLSTYEQLMVLFPVCRYFREVPLKQRVFFDKAQPFPRKLMYSIMEKAYKVKKEKLFDESTSKQKTCKHHEDDKKITKMLSKFENKLNVMSKKIDLLNRKLNGNGKNGSPSSSQKGKS